MPDTTPKNHRLLLLISLLILLSAVPLDVMLPSFPALATHFHTGIDNIALSISIFSIGFSIAQLFVGPLSDRFGRKKLLMIGILLALVGATGCIFSYNYGVFIAFRVLQSIGCASFVLAQAIVQDAFKGTEGVRTRILTTTLSGIFISCSPLLGSILQSALGWEGSFLLFSIISLIILFQVHYRFEETSNIHHGSMLFYGRAYLRILGNRPFLIYSVIGALAFSCHLAFIIVSPTIFIAGLKMNNYHYSLVLLGYGTAYIAGGYLASYAAKIIDTRQQIKLGLLLMMLSGFLMLAMSHYEAEAALTVLLPMLACTAGTVFVRPATATEAMNLFDEIAGTAAAAGSTIRFCAAGTISALVSVMGNNTILNLSWAIIMSSITSILLFAYLQTPIAKGSAESEA
ncbi:MFS transporter [Cupriavidus consociatus]|uniref:MFS transporter n=1 Tax=Cupriavidus consociatus TaxID=2821357 RepID=UPI001AE7D186|nr:MULTISPECIES: MFS transporter [unclassified Cupriavidus]MBP0619149.1 MFS transporter [Cupriavidus sp. LEh25]MDK2655794.1 MFS transporter [Cupriavidus sp. LEh21]